ncbi:hypothetical protein HMPREF3214_01456 [Alloscardovia omnicolens]|nr:hypothetical protein HMPREF3214_01456 [Alloscardovia omnicolens]
MASATAAMKPIGLRSFCTPHTGFLCLDIIFPSSLTIKIHG